MKREAILAAAALCGSLLTVAEGAQAQGVDDLGSFGYDPKTLESPQNWAFELRVGRYYPKVDDEFSGTGVTPFQDSFGKAKRWVIGFELDWQAFRIPYVGSIGPGVGVGATNMSGKVFLDDGTAADEKTKLSIVPAYLVGVLRIDTLIHYTPVPLAFYGKAGLGGALWWTRDNRGITRADDGAKGSGKSYGYHLAVGGMFLLDALDRRRANDLDATRGINHSYVFFEWYNSSLNGFGSGKEMQVGSSSWTAGIAMEM